MRLPVRPLVVAIALSVATLAAAAFPAAGRAAVRTNATYYNDAALPAADPYVLYDEPSGRYYAYSTEGADAHYHFGVYRSADLATWHRLVGGALRVGGAKEWGNDWFWAPEVYRNPRTGLYFLFYAARSDANAKRWFGRGDFAEPSKIGVAVSRSPKGPFRNIAAHPIRYFPYDPSYHDVNRLMGPDQKKPPATLAKGRKAPRGTYMPSIDPNVFFDDDGRQYLYFSRNAYRNWVWDTDLGKYIEESNILAVPLTRAWWNDPSGRTMPTIAPSFRNANDRPGGPRGPRRDGYLQILSYGRDEQPWENADVNDFALTGGEKKDRRWEEGSTTFKTYEGGKAVYYLTYSANNWETPQYGVGYAVASSPRGPWRKHPGNPILAQNAQIGMYSPGHGGIARSPDGRELFYVHHGRPTPDATRRRLYTERLRISRTETDPFGDPLLQIDQATSDRPIPSGVAPYAMRTSRRSITVQLGSTAPLTWRVTSAAGARLALGNALNRVHATVADPAVASVEPVAGDAATVAAEGVGRTTLTLTYQRRRAAGGYADVYDVLPGGARRLVSVTVDVTVLAA
jgi:GH43 family beta-xylosidase